MLIHKIYHPYEYDYISYDNLEEYISFMPHLASAKRFLQYYFIAFKL